MEFQNNVTQLNAENLNKITTDIESKIVKLDSTQTITGTKTFSSPAVFNNMGNAANEAAINVAQGGTLRVGTASSMPSGYITIGDGFYVQMYEAPDDTLNFKASNFKFRTGGGAVNGSSSSTEVFAINNDGTLGKGTYKYALPNKTGTIATTSDITGVTYYSGSSTLYNRYNIFKIGSMMIISGITAAFADCTTKTFTFPESFSGYPNVTVTTTTNAGSDQYKNGCFVTNTTTTAFDVRNHSNASQGVYFIAIGYKSV